MFTSIQNGYVAGEISPSLFGRTDLAKYHQGAFTMRNFFSNYRGGASSRAGMAYVGTCKQPGDAAPPRDIRFQFSLTQGYALEFGDNYMRIKSNGAYVVETPQAIVGISQTDPAVIGFPNHGYSVGDWIFIEGVNGMTEFNGLTWIVSAVVDANNFEVSDLFGEVVDSRFFPMYASGGTAARLFTLETPYAAVDLPYLKYTQSADTMTLTCVNTATGMEYPSLELERFGSTDWTLTQDSFASSIQPPNGVLSVAQSSTDLSTFYSYVVTAVSAKTGEESVASQPTNVENNDISINAGSNTITWNPVIGAGSYNVYQATPSYSVGVAIGSLYGFLGSAFGTSFTDSNITADFTQVPPTHQDPFAQGQILQVLPTAVGSGYDQATVGFTITTSTGAGFAGVPIIVGGSFGAFLIQNSGANYRPTDTITITGGTGATATLDVGPLSGTYPAVAAYYQQRRVYAATLNNPDTYFMSQPGAFSNMDSSIPVTDSDAITGTPWATQVNGVQFMVPMPGGLVVLTGSGAWQVNGGNSAAITPSDQDATPQAYNGSNDIVAPIVVNYDILYLQSKGSIFRDLSYNFFVNIYTGTDLTVLSNHLFANHTFTQWCWAEEPYKLAWAIRDDGVLLSLTYLKEQDVYAWARHDTNGFFVGSVAITEPPVDAPYFIVKRKVRGQWKYYSERMDNRNWTDAEDCWCVDAGLAYPMPTPNATLTADSATGSQNLSAYNIIIGGSNYTSPIGIITDPTGVGAVVGFTVVDGVITEAFPIQEGAGYTDGLTVLTVSDATGSGAIVQPIVTNIVTFTADEAVFLAAAGDVIRMGGGIASVVEAVGSPGDITDDFGLDITDDSGNPITNGVIVASTTVTANLTSPITATIPDDPLNTVIPAVAGTWTLTTPVSVVSGLNHLEGLTAAIVADGGVVTPQVVVNGSVVLPEPASAILVGLPFVAQLQTSYFDTPGQTTVQSKRKNIQGVAVRTEASRGIMVGTNQPDASTQPNGATVPWSTLFEIKERNASIHADGAIPLYTGDSYIEVQGDWATNGQVAFQQMYPMPANILSHVTYYTMGDTDG